jgi:hypothetical protein
MPHLPDGTTVELCWCFTGLPSRIGLIGVHREAVAGRVAQHTGRPAIVPPFASPTEEECRRAPVAAGFREDGMVVPRDGAGGAPQEQLQRVVRGHWDGLRRWNAEWAGEERARWQDGVPSGTGVLARVSRAAQPGVVFARAAASREVDPLLDPDSRVFVGLPGASS